MTLFTPPTIFGIAHTGQIVRLYTLINNQGLTAGLLDYGARLQHLFIPDHDGNIEDVVLGYKTLAEYETCNAYMGAAIGRVANRIRNGRYQLDGKEYVLTTNEGLNQLHGGYQGLDKKIWIATLLSPNKIRFDTELHDQEDGFPGRLKVTLEVEWSDECELIFTFAAESDKTTPVNLTHHGYFNLSAGRESCLGHQFQINSSHYTPVDEDNLPTGDISEVIGTGFDLRHMDSLANHLHRANRSGQGYDHNWVLGAPNRLNGVIQIQEPVSHRQLTFTTTSPGVQIYTGHFLSTKTSKIPGCYYKFSGFCLEPQHYPDSVNHTHFPCIFLYPGDIYTSTTTYAFSVM